MSKNIIVANKKKKSKSFFNIFKMEFFENRFFAIFFCFQFFFPKPIFWLWGVIWHMFGHISIKFSCLCEVSSSIDFLFFYIFFCVFERFFENINRQVCLILFFWIWGVIWRMFAHILGMFLVSREVSRRFCFFFFARPP